MNTYYVNSNYVLNLKKFPPQALRPRTFGYNTVIFNGQEYGSTLFKPQESATFIGTPNAKLGQIEFGPAASGSVLEYVDTTSIYVRGANDIQMRYCTSGKRLNQLQEGLRVLDGAKNGLVQNCLFERIDHGNNNKDVIAILFSNGWSADGNTWTPNLNWVIENCEIKGRWTDGLQICHRNGMWNKFGEAPGLMIRNNLFAVDQSLYDIDGAGPEYLEQAAGFDLKTGGTPDNPIIFDSNHFVGGGQTIRNPYGYQICFQNLCTDVIMRNNTATFPTTAGISLAPIRQECIDAGTGFFNRRLKFYNNNWNVNGTFIWSTDTAEFYNDNITCSKLYDKAVMPYRPERIFSNCNITII